MKKLFVLFTLVVSLLLFSSCGVKPQTGGNINKDEEVNACPPVNDLLPPDENPLAPPEDLPSEDEEEKKKVYAFSTVNGLRVRSKPNGSSSILGTLDKNDAFAILGEQNGFYKTTFKEQTAYVFIDYCSTFEIDVADERAEKAIEFGSTLLGYPYVWGSQRYHWGNGKLNTDFVNGEFDCSALVQYVYYLTNGVILDLTSRTQSLNGVKVERENLKRGDLMFFTNASRKDKTGIERIGHVGIYFGNNYILHTASDHAVIEPISSVRWSYYVTARRVI